MARKGNGKPRAPRREATVIFQTKMKAAIGNATHLIEKLQALQRHKATRTDPESRARYAKLIEVLTVQITGLAPKEDGGASASPFDGL